MTWPPPPPETKDHQPLRGGDMGGAAIEQQNFNVRETREGEGERERGVGEEEGGGRQLDSFLPF